MADQKKRMEELYAGMSLFLIGNGVEQSIPGKERLLIFYCREGNMTCSDGGKEMIVRSGEMVVKAVFSDSVRVHSYGSGLALALVPGEVPDNLSKLASGIDFPLRSWCEPFFSGNAGETMFCVDGDLRTLLSRLMSDGKRESFYRLGVLELLVSLGEIELVTAGSGTVCPRGQQQLARRVADYLCENMDDRITLVQLAEHFHVSGTQLKLSFKAVYGVSIYAYIRTQKMEEAAKMLIDTDLSVLEIAGRLGYENGSKFASAFRAVKGFSPSQFRKRELA